MTNQISKDTLLWISRYLKNRNKKQYMAIINRLIMAKSTQIYWLKIWYDDRGKPFAAIPFIRKGITFHCPFCGKKHNHGTAEGHRVEHCSEADGPVFDEIITQSGIKLKKSDGYVLFYLKSDFSKTLIDSTISPQN